jgi:hypothetical protein
VADGTGGRVERDGPVTVVTIDRPERRNAVDGPGETAAGAAGFMEGRGRHGAALPPNPGPETP